LVHSQNPWPSYTRIFMDVFLRFTNTKRYPEKGSEHSSFLVYAARESIPFLKSTGLVAQSMRIWGVTAIIGRRTI